MEDDEECNDDNYVPGGVEGDVDYNMMDSLFQLSAYVSDNDKEDESDDDNEDYPTPLQPSRNGSDVANHGWTYLAGDVLAPDVVISIDGVDHRLLARAREEVPAVLDKIKRKLFGKRHRDMSKVSPGDFLKAFMDPHLLGYMKAFINNNMSSSNPVTSAEILSFIRVELMLSFYKVSPKMYFHEGNTSSFPSAKTIGMTLARYHQILQCLNASSNVRTKSAVCGYASKYSSTTTGVWQPPMTHNRDLATAMGLVRRICSELAFIPGTTDIGLDDDLLRLRSRKVVLEGYSQINNPNKGLGVIHHGAVSNCTSLYCGGHVASRNESTIDCVKILLLSLSGASIESQIRLNRTKFFWDRGYGGIEGAVNTFAIEKGAVLVGTSQRMKSFPFTFDQNPGQTRRLITEKGTMAAYWAVKGTGRQKQFALANRSGLGRVVLMHTTDPDLGPGRYTLITRNGECSRIRYVNPSDIVIPYITSSVRILTETQRTPEWFLLRKFRITGTGAYCVWKLLSSATCVGLDENVDAVINILALQRNTSEQEEQNLEVDDEHYGIEMLQPKTLLELRIICRGKRLPVSGTKATIIERILSWLPQEQRTTTAQPTILSVLLKSWFMAPLKSKACREGTLNEPFVLANLPAFVLQKSAEATTIPGSRVDIESLHEFGLLCHKDDNNAAFSPDAIAGVNLESPLGGRRYVALVEIKSKCSDATLTAEMELARQYGEYQEIDAERDPLVFKQSIPDASYRCQLLHGMASGCLNDAFYVVASLRKIIRVVHVQVAYLIRQQYLSAIGDLGRQHLGWIVDGNLPATLEIEPASHAVDRHSVSTTLCLWREMSRMISERGRPLPAGRHLLPEVVATWNRGKGPIDVYSRFQKSTKSYHAHLGPIGAIWLRLVMTTVYNAYHSFNLSRTEAFLASGECKSFKEFQRTRARLPPFRQFCHMLADDLQVTVVPPIMYNTSSSDDDEFNVMNSARSDDNGDVETQRRQTRNNASENVSIVYNKRDAYFSMPELIAKRMNRRTAHLPCSLRRQSSCVWCCRLDHSRGGQHSRHGRKTTWYCSICEVSLCKVRRYNELSCFDLFHASHELFDPCCVQAQQMIVSVRGHSNRHPLPPHGAAGPDADPDPVLALARDEDPDVAPVGELFLPAGAEQRHNDSWNQGDADNSAQQVDVEMPLDDGERPTIRRRSSTSVITVPLRCTRQSRFL